jgi:hypothetical protein
MWYDDDYRVVWNEGPAVSTRIRWQLNSEQLRRQARERIRQRRRERMTSIIRGGRYPERVDYYQSLARYQRALRNIPRGRPVYQRQRTPEYTRPNGGFRMRYPNPNRVDPDLYAYDEL